jgi:Cu/Ag efflux protein CusF
MKTSRSPRLLVAAALLSLFAAGASADIVMPKPPAPPHSVEEGYAQGKVIRVDTSKKSVTLKHGPIDNLKMPPMTMAYSVSDAALLARLKAGDAILFKAEERSGSYFVVEAKPDSAPKAP